MIGDSENDPRARLTSRERQILTLIAEGRPTREVAKLLWATDQTIKFHLGNVYRKLGARNRTEASHWAKALGLARPIEDDPEGEATSGVREPRRPIKPTLHGSIALDLP